MKKTLTRSFLGLAMACLALAGPGSASASVVKVFSTFDSDLSVLPYSTNIWYDNIEATPSTFYWTNGVGNPGGAMAVEMSFAQGASQWAWQDYELECNPFGITNGDVVGVNLSSWDWAEFDFACDTNRSIANTSYTNESASSGPYGKVGFIASGWPGWGNNSTNSAAITAEGLMSFHHVGSYVVAPNTNGWFHAKLPISGGFGSTNGNTMCHIRLQCASYPDTNGVTFVRWLFDNIQLSADAKPPTMSMVKAIRGLNFWPPSGVNARGFVATAGRDLLWAAGWTPATYSFTLLNWPSDSSRSNLGVRMFLIASANTTGAPDWDATDVISFDVNTYGTNTYAQAYFRWKTNAGFSNGEFYGADSFIEVTSSTPVGRWSLTFNSPTSVTMKAPDGNSTNFVMGVHPNVPDISGNFSGSVGEVCLGTTESLDPTNIEADLLIFGELDISLMNSPSFSTTNNWLTLTNTSWAAWPEPMTAVGGSWAFVPAANANWISWTVPDAGFYIQTNTVDMHATANWFTNTGLPGVSRQTLAAKSILVKPGDLPSTPRLLYRMALNPAQ